jgi:parvulin-like peptidyl-prolyl isomerase
LLAKEVRVVKKCLVLMAIFALMSGCAKEKEPEATKVVQPVPPGSIRASHILISYQGIPQINATRTKEEAKALAEDLLARVKAGESFEELARTHSDCPTAEKGGDLGFFKKGRMVKPFEDAAFTLNVDGISGVVETKFGYHLIMRTQ